MAGNVRTGSHSALYSCGKRVQRLTNPFSLPHDTSPQRLVRGPLALPILDLFTKRTNDDRTRGYQLEYRSTLEQESGHGFLTCSPACGGPIDDS